MKKALISIDYTYDFVADDGKLTAGKSAQAIEEAITEVEPETVVEETKDEVPVATEVKATKRGTRKSTK